jgi:hypothetical protein
MNETTDANADLVLEILKKIQSGMAELRNVVTDTRQDIRGVKDEIVSLRTIMAEFLKTDARRETDYLNLAARVERIERRIDAQDIPH